MTLHDSLQSMGRKHARALELERLQQWRQSMGQAWLDKAKDVYKWIKNDYQAPLVVLKDPQTGGLTANVNRMDEILHESWDKQEAGLCQHRLLSVRTGTLAAAHSSGGGAVDSGPGAPAGHDHLPALPVLQTGR